MREPLPAAEALRAVRALAASRSSWTVLVDGRSGSGKTTLAPVLAASTGAVLVRLDDLYPGWDGLAAGTAAVTRDLLRPRAADRPGSWRRWDWAAGASSERHAVPATGGLVVEGSGVLTRASARLAQLSIWVELDDAERRRRALARDGDLYAPHWDRWAAQEAVAIAANHPRSLATLVVDGRRLLSGRSLISMPMSDSTTSAEPKKYVAEYLDGPLEGTTEHRYLQDGEPEDRVTQYALVDGTDAMFEYVAGDRRELNGEQFVQYSFDQGDSDVLQGQADPEQESKHL